MRAKLSAPAFLNESVGEIAAAYCAKKITTAEAISAAYCRGKAVSQNRRMGLMLAVGLSEKDCQAFLAGFEDDVKVAAINSVNSTTLSGDRDKVEKIRGKLQEAGVFARALETGNNAYHSHHMTEIGNIYEQLVSKALAEFSELRMSAHESRSENCSWVSSAAPYKTLHLESLGPKYWALNLQSPVRFSEAVEELLSPAAPEVGIVVEIGPRSALRSPLSNMFGHLQEKNGIQPPKYLASLRRKYDSQRSLLELCGKLYALNSSVNISAVNSTESSTNDQQQTKKDSVCLDLPHYPYSYGPPLVRENRIHREIRLRENLRHDLLGSQRAGCAHGQPSWRNIFRVKDVPWLSHHRASSRAFMSRLH